MPILGTFDVFVTISIVPGSEPFARFAGLDPLCMAYAANADTIQAYLYKDGWCPVVIDAGGPPTNRAAPETRTIKVTLGKVGAKQADADQAVNDAFNRAGVWTKIERGANAAVAAGVSSVQQATATAQKIGTGIFAGFAVTTLVVVGAVLFIGYTVAKNA